MVERAFDARHERMNDRAVQRARQLARKDGDQERCVLLAVVIDRVTQRDRGELAETWRALVCERVECF